MQLKTSYLISTVVDYNYNTHPISLKTSYLISTVVDIMDWQGDMASKLVI